MIKAVDRIGCATDVPTQHLAIMWEKARRMGRHLDAAIFIGGPPALVLASASKVPYGVDEFGIAGALNGAPIELVKAEMSDLLVRLTPNRHRRPYSHGRAGTRSAVRRSERISRTAQAREDL